MSSPPVPELVVRLGSNVVRTHQQAAEHLLLAGEAAVVPLIGALADIPGPLASDRAERRRRAARAVTVLGRIGAPAAPALVAALAGSDARTRPALAAALRAVGRPAVCPLADWLRAAPADSPAWHAADETLCAIVGAPSRRVTRVRSQALRAGWTGAVAAAMLLAAAAWMAELGPLASLATGLAAGYLVFALVVTGRAGAEAGLRHLWAVATAPRSNRVVRGHDGVQAQREAFEQTYLNGA